MAAVRGMANSAVATATYTILQLLPTPTFRPASRTYDGPQYVSTSDPTPGATIYYTTDGSTPTTASPIYTNPVLVTQTTIGRATSRESGMVNGGVASATYTILQQVATPKFSPRAGTYAPPVYVPISARSDQGHGCSARDGQQRRRHRDVHHPAVVAYPDVQAGEPDL